MAITSIPKLFIFWNYFSCDIRCAIDVAEDKDLLSWATGSASPSYARKLFSSFNFEDASNLSESDKNNVLYGRLNLQFHLQSSWNVSDYKHMKYWMKSNRNLIVQLRLRWRLMLMWQAVRNDATTYRAIQKSENYVRVWFKFIDRHVSLFQSLSQSL